MNNNDDLISRAALRHDMYEEAFMKDSNMQKWDGGCWIRYKMFERVIDRQPSVKKAGRWILTKTKEDCYGNLTFTLHCSECDAVAYEFNQRFCHNCGAKMQEASDGI